MTAETSEAKYEYLYSEKLNTSSCSTFNICDKTEVSVSWFSSSRPSLNPGSVLPVNRAGGAFLLVTCEKRLSEFQTEKLSVL